MMIPPCHIYGKTWLDTKQNGGSKFRKGRNKNMSNRINSDFLRNLVLISLGRNEHGGTEDKQELVLISQK